MNYNPTPVCRTLRLASAPLSLPQLPAEQNGHISSIEWIHAFIQNADGFREGWGEEEQHQQSNTLHTDICISKYSNKFTGFIISTSNCRVFRYASEVLVHSAALPRGKPEGNASHDDGGDLKTLPASPTNCCCKHRLPDTGLHRGVWCGQENRDAE
jgi:hypothetical protein